MDESAKKRGWVKNAAIIFLSVMLVLTFFSQTILNRSLPEVSARYLSSGTINARIRGSGTVSANDSYEVVLNQTRTVREVNVRLGNAVEVGDTLLTLEQSGSAELEAARAELHRLTLEYERAVITASLDGDYASEERSIRLARQRLDELDDERDEVAIENEDEIEKAHLALAEAQAALLIADNVVASAESRVAYAKSRVATAKATRESADELVKAREAAVRTAQANLDALGGENNPNTTALQRQIADKQADLTRATNERSSAWLIHEDSYRLFEESAKLHFSTATSLPPVDWEARTAIYLAAYAQWMNLNQSPNAPNAPELVAYETISGLDNAVAGLRTELDRLRQDLSVIQRSENSSQYSLLSGRLNDAKAMLTAAESSRDTAAAAQSKAESELAEIEAELREHEAEQNKAKTDVTAAENDLKQKQDSQKNALRQADEAIKTQQRNLEDLLFALSEKQKTDGVAGALTALNMAEQRNQMSQKRDDIARLEEDSTGMVITSPVSGIIKQISISSGNQTQPGTPLIVIEVSDRGYTLSIPVTLEQSRTVSVGDIAEAERYWWGEVRIILAAIRNDPQNPATGRLLVFNVSGDVESGTQLSVSIGQRSQNYQVIVPNSALRSDTNGDFVLVVVARSSPLGNRYIATRVDVNILASDDTQTAVSGGLATWDFVITTSSRPLEPGMQVRLVN